MSLAVEALKPVTERPSRDEWAALRRAQGRVTSENVLSGAILLRYQQRVSEACEKYRVVVVEKSRRTGATWGAAADGVLRSASPRGQGGMDTLYIGTSQDMAREFIDAAALWARAFEKTMSSIEETLFDDGSETGIKAFRIDFASGFEIVALSSRPRSLRGRQGFAVLDEAAFADDLNELLKAALAFLIWGGRVLVISTHNGAANPFNALVEDIRSGRKDYGLIRFTLDDALIDGLFERICALNPRDHGVWSPDKEADWREALIRDYGDGADEELYCIPAQGSGVWLSPALIEACMTPGAVLRLSRPAAFTFKPETERRSEIAAWLDDYVKPVMRESLDPVLRSALGMDVARYTNLTVITPVQETRLLQKHVPFVIEMNGIPFQQQQQVWRYVFDGLPRRCGGKIDATGIGAQLGEEEQQHYSPSHVEAVKFSAEWWRTKLPPVKKLFEDRDILIPRDSELKSDLRAVKLVHGVAQLLPLRVKAAAGGIRHGDFVPALALAIDALNMSGGDYGYTGARADDDDNERRDRRLEDASAGGRRDGLW